MISFFPDLSVIPVKAGIHGHGTSGLLRAAIHGFPLSRE
jgi:hypothetical protein